MASDVERDADRHESETKTELQTRRTDLQREVDELTRFAADYRAALENHVVRQRRHLDGTADKVYDGISSFADRVSVAPGAKLNKPED